MKRSDKAAAEIIDNLRRIFQTVNESAREAEHVAGLTGPQLWALKILDSSAPLRVSDLARAMCLRSATVVGILDRLEAKNLVTRVRSSSDRRVVELSLTDLGRDEAEKAPDVAERLLMSGLVGLPNDQLRCVETGMKLVVKLLKAERAEPKPLH